MWNAVTGTVRRHLRQSSVFPVLENVPLNSFIQVINMELLQRYLVETVDRGNNQVRNIKTDYTHICFLRRMPIVHFFTRVRRLFIMWLDIMCMWFVQANVDAWWVCYEYEFVDVRNAITIYINRDKNTQLTPRQLCSATHTA